MPSDPTQAATRFRAARAAVVADTSVRGEALREALTSLADGWLATLLGDEGDVALVAVGGYGRREPAPGSDLDLVLVHRGRRDVKEVADRVWYPVWDAGVSLDHSVRTVAEAVSVARTDLKAALGLLDARLVAGDPDLARELRTAVLETWRREVRKRLPELREAIEERAASSGELAFLLEPDLKDCRGGMRDVHALRALAAAWATDPPGERVRAAYALLLDVRGELHRRAGRGTDRLVLQEQAPIAEALGHDGADALMTAVYDAARSIAFVSDETWRRVGRDLAPRRRVLPGRRTSTMRQLAESVVEQDGEVVLARDADPQGDSLLLLRVARAAAEAGVPIALPVLDRLVADAAPLPEPWPRVALDQFVALLSAGRGTVAVVEALDHAGLFARLLPEWERVRCRPQRNAVHRFTVDRHLVETAVEASLLTREVSRPDLLALAALLHDIGKGSPGDHTEAGLALIPAIAERMGLRKGETDTLVALVRHHLLLPDTATRRDLDDPATIRLVTDAVGDRETLQLLHALTEADAKATGPAAWGEWKARLVGDLVRRCAAVLAGERVPEPEPLTEPQQELAAAGALAVAVEEAGEEFLVTLVAPDRAGLLATWAGVLALHRLEIRAATATSVGPTAVTVFRVEPRFGTPPDWDVVRADVRRAYEGALPLTQRLTERARAYRRAAPLAAPPRVLWFDDESVASTIVEVRAHDSVGLLHRLAAALADCDLDVRAARASTLGAEAVDAFYVATAGGARIDDEGTRRAVEAALLAACDVEPA